MLAAARPYGGGPIGGSCETFLGPPMDGTAAAGAEHCPLLYAKMTETADDVVVVAVRAPDNTGKHGGDILLTHTVGYLVGGHSADTAGPDKKSPVCHGKDVDKSVGTTFPSG